MWSIRANVDVNEINALLVFSIEWQNQIQYVWRSMKREDEDDDDDEDDAGDADDY